MKLSDIKKQVQYYFDNKTPEDVIKDLEEAGVKFKNDSFACDWKVNGYKEKCKVECDWCKYWNNYLNN